MRDAGRCDVAALGITDNRPVAISACEAPAHIVRDVRRRLSFEYLFEREGARSRGLAPRRLTLHSKFIAVYL